MKTLFPLFLLTVFSLVAHADYISCTSDEVSVAGNWSPGESFTDITIASSGASKKLSSAPLKAYNPKNAKFKNMNRFELANDGWSATSILLPRAGADSNSFTGYFYDQGEAGRGTIVLDCELP